MVLDQLPEFEDMRSNRIYHEKGIIPGSQTENKLLESNTISETHFPFNLIQFRCLESLIAGVSRFHS
jgi:hypothetical protein